jgi:hypothetical protein
VKYLRMDAKQKLELIRELEGMPAFLEAAFLALSSGDATRRGPGDIFSPVEQCWHLADLEREGFGVRIDRLRRESAPILPDFEGASVAKERDYKSRSLREGLALFREERKRNLLALRSLEAHEWSRQGMQEGVGTVSLCDIPTFMAQHDSAHRGEIEAWQRARNDLGGRG